MKFEKEEIPCPLCGQRDNYLPWAEENGYSAVKCQDCGLVYVNPRPSAELISDAVKTGVHREVDSNRTAIVRRVPRNITLYREILSKMFADVWSGGSPITWLDIGAGYGEVVEAIDSLAPANSKIEGIEPMTPKVNSCKERGLRVREAYLNDVSVRYDYVSLVNVFSHIPDFKDFLLEIKRILKPGGGFFLETGNIGDLATVKEVPTELDLPDHLVFAGEKQIEKFLTESGFDVVQTLRRRKDTVFNAIKNVAKKLLGRNVTLSIPYTSPYRTLLIRAQLKSGK